MRDPAVRHNAVETREPCGTLADWKLQQYGLRPRSTQSARKFYDYSADWILGGHKGRRVQLRDEIIEAEKARHDLFKWKLILSAVLAAAGLGLGTATLPATSPLSGRLDYTLVLIPFVCLYVDLIARQMQLRILVIGTYLRLYGNEEEKCYEGWVEDARRLFLKASKEEDVYRLEEWSLQWSTIALSSLVLFYGALDWGLHWDPSLFERIGLPVRAYEWSLLLDVAPFMAAGLLGLWLSTRLRKRFKERVDALSKLAEKHERRIREKGTSFGDD